MCKLLNSGIKALLSLSLPHVCGPTMYYIRQQTYNTLRNSARAQFSFPQLFSLARVRSSVLSMLSLLTLLALLSSKKLECLHSFFPSFDLICALFVSFFHSLTMSLFQVAPLLVCVCKCVCAAMLFFYIFIAFSTPMCVFINPWPNNRQRMKKKEKWNEKCSKHFQISCSSTS